MYNEKQLHNFDEKNLKISPFLKDCFYHKDYEFTYAKH